MTEAEITVDKVSSEEEESKAKFFETETLREMLEEFYEDAFDTVTKPACILKAHVEQLKEFLQANEDKLAYHVMQEPPSECIAIPLEESWIVVTLGSNESEDLAETAQQQLDKIKQIKRSSLQFKFN